MSAPIEIHNLTQDEIANAADYMVQMTHHAMPDDVVNTTPINAWAGILSTAINWGGIAGGMTVNGGGLAGVVVCTPDLADTSTPKRLILRALNIGFDAEANEPLMLAWAKEQAAGRKIVRKDVTVTFTEV